MAVSHLEGLAPARGEVVSAAALAMLGITWVVVTVIAGRFLLKVLASPDKEDG